MSYTNEDLSPSPPIPPEPDLNSNNNLVPDSNFASPLNFNIGLGQDQFPKSMPKGTLPPMPQSSHIGISPNIDSTNARLGKVFSAEHLARLKKDLEDSDLPTIPFDASLKELENLLVYQGNMLPYLMVSLETVKKEEERLKIVSKQIYNEVYANVAQTSADRKVTTLKSITEGNKRVKEANENFSNIQGLKGLIESRINALNTQNITVRKIITLKVFALQQRLE